MLCAAVSIAKDGSWSASTGEIYAVFLGIHIIQGFLGCSITRILARLQNIFLVANFAIILATFAALPATTPKDERNSAAFIFTGEDWTNLTGWTNGFAFIICTIFSGYISDSQLGFHPFGVSADSILACISPKRPLTLLQQSLTQLRPQFQLRVSLDGFALLSLSPVWALAFSIISPLHMDSQWPVSTT
jgi:hypothetical protein